MKKEKSYVERLTAEDIQNILTITGYELLVGLRNNRTNEFIPPVERVDNGQSTILIRCKKIDTKNPLKDVGIDNPLLNKLKVVLGGLSFDDYESSGLIFINDFEFNELMMWDFDFDKANDENSNAYKYAKYMAKKFGPKYIEEYNEFADKYNAELEKSNNENSL